MFLGFIFGIVIAYILTIFNIDQIIISGVRDLINIDIGHSGYYLSMGIMGGISTVMIAGLISGLLIAYLFTFIALDQLIVEGIGEWFKYDMSMSAYYLIFAIIGAGTSLLEVVKMVLSPFFSVVRRKNH